ncbi:MAG: hypothetical protein QW540_07740 [Archaeoglobaceae archaeon]
MLVISTTVCILIALLGLLMIFMKIRKGFIYIAIAITFIILNTISQDISLAIAAILAVTLYELRRRGG